MKETRTNTYTQGTLRISDTQNSSQLADWRHEDCETAHRCCYFLNYWTHISLSLFFFFVQFLVILVSFFSPSWFVLSFPLPDFSVHFQSLFSVFLPSSFIQIFSYFLSYPCIPDFLPSGFPLTACHLIPSSTILIYMQSKKITQSFLMSEFIHHVS